MPPPSLLITLLSLLSILPVNSLANPALLPLAPRAPFPKRGLPFNNPSTYIQNWNGDGSQVNWAYNWDSAMDDNFPQFMEYIPMLWGDGADHTNNWFNNVNSALARGSGHIIAFNEPDACGGGGSCMSPQHAADAYRTYIMPFAGRATLGAPAVTNGPDGLPWLREFLRLCGDCQIDFVPIHWYDAWDNPAYLRAYIDLAHDAAGGRQLWLTEFNARGSVDEQAAFLREVMPWLDNHPHVFRYAWFWCHPSFGQGALVGGDGAPSDLGMVYAYTPY